MTDAHSGPDIERIGGAGLRGPAVQGEQGPDLSVRSAKVSFCRELGQRVCVCVRV